AGQAVRSRATEDRDAYPRGWDPRSLLSDVAPGAVHGRTKHLHHARRWIALPFVSDADDPRHHSTPSARAASNHPRVASPATDQQPQVIGRQTNHGSEP